MLGKVESFKEFSTTCEIHLKIKK